MEALFWFAVAVLAYTYVGFPMLLWMRATFLPRTVRRSEITPIASLIIVAHNEAAVIRRKLDNMLALDYPRDRLQIIVASDGSSDGTNEIIAQEPGVTFLPYPRRGKIPALNAAVAVATGDILVFSDANSMFDHSAIRNLVRNFVDASVGGVAGNQSYMRGDVVGASGTGERAYWSFDQWLKQQESASGNVTSATGAIYAIRRCLFRPVPLGVCDDAANSYTVVAAGWRMVYEPEAVAWESVAPSEHAEFRRKARVCLRGLRALSNFSQLFNPLRYGFYSIQLLSHKLLRRLTAWPLLLLLLSSSALARSRSMYAAALAVQLSFYAAAIAALLLPKKLSALRAFKLVSLPFYFCMANIAFVLAQARFVMGQQVDHWDVTRAQTESR